MKAMFDPSAVVAALWQDHPRHQAAIQWMVDVHQQRVSGFISQSAIAEVFSALTNLPVSPPFHPHSVKTVLSEALWHLQIVPLDEADYIQLLEEATDLDVRGDSIYALLHLRTAQKAEVETLLTTQSKIYPTQNRVKIVSL